MCCSGVLYKSTQMFYSSCTNCFEIMLHYFKSLWIKCVFVPFCCCAGLGLWGWGFRADPEGSHWFSTGHLLWPDWKAAGFLLRGHDHQTLGLPRLWVHQDHAWYLLHFLPHNYHYSNLLFGGGTFLNGLWLSQDLLVWGRGKGLFGGRINQADSFNLSLR